MFFKRKPPVILWMMIMFMIAAVKYTAYAQTVITDLKLHPQEKVLKITAGTNVKHWAAVTVSQTETGSRIYNLHTDSGKRGPFLEFDLHSLRFHSDGSTLLYAAYSPGKEKEPAGWHIFSGQGKEGPFSNLIDVTYSPDGKPASIIATRTDGHITLYSGKELDGVFSALMNAGASVKGTRFFLLRNDQGYVLSIGEKRFGPFDAIDAVRASDRLETIVFRYVRDGNTYLFDGRAAQGPFDECGTPIVSADGTAVAYSYKNAGSWSVMFNGKRVGTHQSVMENLYLSGDNSRVVYWVKEKENYYLISATAKLGPYSAPGIVAYPPGKAILVYSGGIGNDSYLISGEGRFGPYRAIHDIRYSTDGKMYGWLSSDASGNVLQTRAGSVKRIPDMIEYIGGLTLSPSGAEVAAAGRDAQGYAIWKGGVKYGTANTAFTRLTYQPNGKLLEAYAPATSESILIAEDGSVSTGFFLETPRGAPSAALWEHRGKILYSRF